MTSLADLDDDDEEEELAGLMHADEDENGLSASDFTITAVLVEGWLHKKGTGHDWMGSRAWKARWGRLCLAKFADQPVPVPLLLMYWYPSSRTHTTAILLDATVVVAVDTADPQQWNAHRFEIRQVHDDENTNRRTFCAAAAAERDAWVYAMATALLEHAKRQAAVAHKPRVTSMAMPRANSARGVTTVPSRATSPPPRSLSPPMLPKSPRSVRPTAVVAPHTYQFD